MCVIGQRVRSATCAGSQAARRQHDRRTRPSRRPSRSRASSGSSPCSCSSPSSCSRAELLRVPTAFDDGAKAPFGRRSRAGQDPERTSAASARTSRLDSPAWATASAAATATRISTSTARGRRPAAALRARRSARSAARPTSASTSTLSFTATCCGSSARRRRRLGLRDRARGRPPRAAPARHRREVRRLRRATRTSALPLLCDSSVQAD